MKQTGEDRKLFLDYLKRFCLLDDTFMRKCFEGDKNKCVQEVLRIILNEKDLEVEYTNAQHIIANLQGREIQLDIYAVDTSDIRYDIEIQNINKGANPQRARYNSSLIDANILPKGEETINLPVSYVIFITRNDFFNKSLPIYHIERYIEETKELFNDGEHIIYINGAYKDTDTVLGRLIHDLKCTNADDIFNEVLRQRVKLFKESEEGVNNMCQLMEELKQIGIGEGKELGKEIGKAEERTNFIKAMLELGVPESTIQEAIKNMDKHSENELCNKES